MGFDDITCGEEASKWWRAVVFTALAYLAWRLLRVLWVILKFNAFCCCRRR